MPRSHLPYAPEFRRQMAELVRSGRTPEAPSREFEPAARAPWNSRNPLMLGICESGCRLPGVRTVRRQDDLGFRRYREVANMATSSTRGAIWLARTAS